MGLNTFFVTRLLLSNHHNCLHLHLLISQSCNYFSLLGAHPISKLEIWIGHVNNRLVSYRCHQVLVIVTPHIKHLLDSSHPQFCLMRAQSEFCGEFLAYKHVQMGFIFVFQRILG